MNDQAEFCVSVFKSGAISREEYTAMWIKLVNQLIKDGEFPSSEEEK